MNRYINLQAQQRAASIRGTSISDRDRTFEIVFSTGSAVRRYDVAGFREVDEKLSMQPAHVRMDRLKSGAMPLLDSHNADVGRILGVVLSGDIDGREGRAKIKFANTSDVQTVWQKVRGGIIKNASCGYLVHQYREISQKSDKIPTLLAVDWEPVEISLVPVAADPRAGVRGQNPQSSQCRILPAAPTDSRLDMERWRRELDELRRWVQ